MNNRLTEENNQEKIVLIIVVTALKNNINVVSIVQFSINFFKRKLINYYRMRTSKNEEYQSNRNLQVPPGE